MKKRILTIAALAAMLPWHPSAGQAARLEVSTGEPVEVYIAVGLPTVVTFPEPVKAIPTSADPEAVSMEAEGSRLFIQSLRKGFGGIVFVIDESDRLHILKLVERNPPDTEVQLVLPQAPPRFGDETGRPGGPPVKRPRGSPLRRLLVALLKGERLPGSRYWSTSRCWHKRKNWRYARHTCMPPVVTWGSWAKPGT